MIDGATISAAITTNDQAVTINKDGSLEVTATAEGGRGVYPTELTYQGSKIALTKQGYEKGLYSVSYKDAAGNSVLIPHEVGDYTATLTFNSGSDYNGCTKTFTFRIVPAEIGEVTVEGDFVYDGTDQTADIKDAIRVDGMKIDQTQFDVTIDKKGGDTSDSDSDPAVDAGDYVVKLVGKSGIYKNATSDFGYFTIDKLDLSKADVVINDMTLADFKATIPAGQNQAVPNVFTVNGKATNSKLGLTVSFVTSSTDSVDMVGSYTYKVASTNTANVINSKDVSFNVVENVIGRGDCKYDMGSLATNYYIDARRESFNTALLNATYGGKAVDLDVTVTDVEGNKVSASELKTAGLYTVTLTPKFDTYKYALGGKVSFSVRVIAGVVENAGVTFSYNGVMGIDNAADTYDGSNLLENLGIAVYDNLGVELTQGEDYDVTVTDAAGNELSEIVDAGTYKVTVSSSSYVIKGPQVFTLTVSPVTVDEVRVSNLTSFGDRSFYPYTGSDIAVQIEYKDGDEWKALPTDIYELVFKYGEKPQGSYSVIDSVNKVGFYKVFVHQAEGVKNYKLDDGNRGFLTVSNYVTDTDSAKTKVYGTIEVSDQGVYSDVSATDWGSEEIYKAWDLGYMGGYNGTSIFGKDDFIKRGDVAQVLYNMAGSPRVAASEGNVGQTGDEYETGFSDVKPSMYYAKAIAWASACGIVSGDEGTSNFRPEDTVSRQELAKMLCEYARVTGADTSADASVLDSYSDAGEVSDWAVDYVAWAVENDIMGVGTDELWATGGITRRMVAMMTVRFQPDGKLDGGSMIPSLPR